MTDLRLLRPLVLSQQPHAPTIPFKCWLWFKAHLLENKEMRGLLDRPVELPRDAFCDILCEYIKENNNSPRWCRTGRPQSFRRRSKEAWKLLTSCYGWYLELLSPNSRYQVRESKNGIQGLGLFARVTMSVSGSSPLKGLTGFLNKMYQHELERLDEAGGYPSIWEDTGLDSLIYYCGGPVALANHSCASHLSIKRIIGGGGGGDGEDGHESLQIVVAKGSTYQVQAGHQIYINYGSKYFQNERCRCRKCGQKRRADEPTDENDAEKQLKKPKSLRRP